MTGYGQARWEGDGWVIGLEVRSVNGRYFKLSCRLPHEFGALERELEKRVRQRVVRGSVDLSVRLEATGARAARPLNRAALAAYVRELRQVGEELGVPVTLSADAAAVLPGVIEAEEATASEADALRGPLLTALDSALEELDRMRLAEGASLRGELLSHAEAIQGLLTQVEEAQANAVEEHRRRLVERVNRLLDGSGVSVGEADLAREVAIYADRSDVTEEIARLRSHLEQMREALDGTEPAGRRLEFIAQELNREVNTLAAKVAGAALSRAVVALQGAVDKIREQVLNVE